jgi:succinylarginine dihydrolase
MKRVEAFEVNFDGLVGPTHNYAGLAMGNIASIQHAFQISNPKAAALQGLEKMRLLMELGIPQAVLPPHPRPYLPLLKNLGFQSNQRVKESEVLQMVHKTAPDIFRAAYSASSMWMANAATVTPSMDCADGRVHITPANMTSHLHRMIESKFNNKLFNLIFSDKKQFVVHPPLINSARFADEGAANHNRFCLKYGDVGLHLFVYGRHAVQKKEINAVSSLPKQYVARQTFEAGEAVARLHLLPKNKVLFAKQNPVAIDQGVFHNDVIAVANQNVFLYHELAWEDTKNVTREIKQHFSDPGLKSDLDFFLIEISESELSLEESVRTYLFNSQLITLPNNTMALLAPLECQESPRAYQVLKRILSDDNPIESLHFVDCRQSMRNGGGPACLRLRMVLTESEIKACHPNIFLDEALYKRLVNWVKDHYRDRISAEDLLDPALLEESESALFELSRILNMSGLY